MRIKWNPSPLGCTLLAAMHNVKRVPVSVQSAEVLEQRRAEEARKLDTYKQIEDTYLEHVSKSHTHKSDEMVIIQPRHWRVPRPFCLAIPNTIPHGTTGEQFYCTCLSKVIPI